MKETTRALTESTIRDFGEQWTIYSDNEGKDLYPARELFADVVGPLISLGQIPRRLRRRKLGPAYPQYPAACGVAAG